MTYNTIQHEIRNNVGLSMLDYCILEMIYNLSNSGKERYRTWCNAAKPKFKHLSTGRTIINRFNYLESNGWIEFKDEKRFLKRTTDKYYNDVYVYIKGVKELHGETITPVKELHPSGEIITPLGVKELHGRGVKVAPNKDIDKDINNIDKESKGKALSKISDLETKIKNLESQLALNAEKENQEKSCEKKESHTFPSNEPKKKYKVPKTDSESKPYEVFLHNYPFNDWSEKLKQNFLLYCEVKHENSKGKYSPTQIKMRIAEIVKAMDKHEMKTIEDMVISGANGSWADFQFDERIKERKLKKKKESNKNDNDTPSYMLGVER